MNPDRDTAGTGRFLSPLDRARLVSDALSDAARRARLSTRSRRHAAGGFGARDGQVFMRLFMVATFWLLVAVPSVVCTFYFGLLASDQYLAEIKFTVAGSEAPVVDGLGSLTGIPSANVLQDTQIVANHLQSRAAVELLEKMVGLRAHYSDKKNDWWARFDADKPIERFVKYWKNMSSVAIQMPAGILDVRVRAFTPEAARDIAAALITISEKLVNDINERMNRDAVAYSEAEVERASQRLSLSRINLLKGRNDEGMLDATRAAEGVNKLINESRAALLQIQAEYRTQLRVVTEAAPQMQATKARIKALQDQIADMEAQLTGRDSGLNSTLSTSMMRFSELELERSISEKLYAGAVASLEIARMNAERKKVYLNTFISPSLPQEARYPRRLLSIALMIGAFTAVWGMLVGLVILARNHMA